MIKISTPIDTSIKARPTKKRDVCGGGSGIFSDLIDDIASSNARAIESSQILSASDLDMILSAQSVNNDFVERQRSVRSAHMTLDSLELLRFALLNGSVPAYLLQTIEHRMHELKHLEPDPMLREILEEIELRAAVELAKLQQLL